MIWWCKDCSDWATPEKCEPHKRQAYTPTDELISNLRLAARLCDLTRDVDGSKALKQFANAVEASIETERTER